MANDLNHWIGIGRITRDMEIKYTPGGTACGKFAIAVNKRRKQGEQYVDEASFFDIVLWGKSAENLNQYLLKGKQVAIDGELHQNRWEHEGKSMSKVEITANNVQLLGGKDGSSSGATGGTARATAPDFPDDEIPFDRF